VAGGDAGIDPRIEVGSDLGLGRGGGGEVGGRG